MRSFFAHKSWIILLAVLAIGALLGLAIGMRSVSFREAQSFGRNEPTVRTAPLYLIDSMLSVPWQTQVSVWVLIVLMFVLISVLLSPEMRKRVIRAIIRMALTYWGLYILFTRYRQVLAQIGMNLAPPGDLPAAGSNGEAPPVFTPPSSVSWLSYVVSFAIAVLLIILAWKLNSVWRELNTRASDSSMHKLAKIARSSLHDLSSGRDSSDVIMNCYYRMSDVISDKKNIKRKDSMTPQEFAARLEQTGLPADAVNRLTRLFESVRYGGYRSDTTSVNEAVACLTTILHACGETV